MGLEGLEERLEERNSLFLKAGVGRSGVGRTREIPS